MARQFVNYKWNHFYKINQPGQIHKLSDTLWTDANSTLTALIEIGRIYMHNGKMNCLRMSKVFFVGVLKTTTVMLIASDDN